MRIAIRTDINNEIGSGHWARCVTLAKALLKKGAKIDLFTFKTNENKNLLKKNNFFKIIILKNKNKIFISEKADANIFLEAKQKSLKKKYDWIVVDSYNLGQEWESKVKKASRKMLVIDDLANRRHNCDVLLDQNEFNNKKKRYKNLTNKNCCKLLGAKYALLNPVYKKLKNKTKIKGPKKNILIYFGGVDKYNLIQKSLKAIKKINYKKINATVVCPQLSKKLDLPKEKNVHILHPQKNLGKVFYNADIAVGAGGTSTWERLCLNLPSIIISVAKNQHRLCKELDIKGYIKWLGPADKVNTNAIMQALERIIKDKIKLKKPPLHLVDGKGTERVVQRMLRLLNR
jgi:UDP-2,4-diacetamido-2,4,6-trideoxy-beta-L-altropyranose hydrolase